MTTMIKQDWILEQLYVIMRGGVFEGGWINADELLHEMTHDRNYDYTADKEFLYYAGSEDVVRVFRELQRRELVEQNRNLPDLWRIAPSFYASLDEWCERVMEVLETEPCWHDAGTVDCLVARVSLLHMSVVTRRTILHHLQETHGAAIEIDTEFDADRVRIKLSEWLKRCQTPARSL